MIVLGIDGGFSHLGLAAISLEPNAEKLIRAWVVTTEKSAKKHGVREADDSARRTRELTYALVMAIKGFAPGAIALEAPSWPRNAGVSAKLGMAFGVVFALAELFSIPLVMASPQDVKKAVCGFKTASKEDVERAIATRFPTISWPRQATLREHSADAVGVVLACLASDVLRMARRAA